MKLSICIPNYNYEKYLGETLRSVLGQPGDYEVLVSDNASIDRSLEVVRSFNDPRVKISVNETNVGFAGNLDRAGRMATGEWMLMLSSDDLVKPQAIETYQRLVAAIEPDAVVSGAADVVDSNGAPLRSLDHDPELWLDTDRVSLPGFEGIPIYRVAASELLRRSLLTCRNPFNFLSTAYPRALYQRVEGYGGNRLINPDKWFHWKLLGVASFAYFVGQPFFAYRWHEKNQAAQQARSGALKYMVDEYTNTFEVDKALLERAGISREQLERAFVEYDVARHGLAVLANPKAESAHRVLLFGVSAYPKHVLTNWKAWALGGLLVAGPLGRAAAKASYLVFNARRPSAAVKG